MLFFGDLRSADDIEARLEVEVEFDVDVDDRQGAGGD